MKSPSKLISLIILFIVVFSSFSSFSSFAQGTTDKKLKEAIDAFYNFEFIIGEELLNDLASEFPDEPIIYHYKSIEHLWLYLDSKNETHLNNFLALSDSAIGLADAKLDSVPDDINTHFILGAAYTNRALAFARGEEYLKALWATKKFYSHLSETLVIDSTYFDAYLGLGIYNFAASQTLPGWKWALELTGISGDRFIGFDYIKIAASKGNYTKTDAEFYLSQLLAEFLLRYKEAEQLLNKLIKKYPGNLLFKYTLADLKIETAELPVAEKLLRTIIASPDSNFIQLKAYSKLLLGNIFYFKNKFDSAKVYYQQFLSSAIDDHFKGITALRLAMCYFFKNDFIESKYYFALTGDGNLDLDEDRFAKIIGEEYLDNPPDSLDLKLVLIDNLIRSGNYKKAKDSLLVIFEDSVSNEVLAEAYLHLADVSFYLSKYKESLDYAIKAFNLELAEKWVRAFACYYAARASYNLKSFIDAKLFIQYAENYNDYFFENRLRKLLYALSFKLNE